MYRDQAPPNITASQGRQSSPGRTPVEYRASANQVVSDVIGSMINQIAKENQTRKRKSVTVESRRTARKTTSRGKSNICETSIPGGSSSLILDQDSIGTEKTLEPFFNGDYKDVSSLLRSLIKTDSPASDTKLSNSSWYNVEFNSYATLRRSTPRKNKSSLKISLQSSQSLVPKSTAGESIKKEKRIRMIRVMPTKEQKKIFKRWFGTCRKIFNDTVAYERKYGIRTHRSHFQWLRNRFVTGKNLPKKYQWMKETPKHVREGAIKDFVTARKSAIANLKAGNIKKFRIGFRSKKDEQSILIPKQFIKSTAKEISVYPSFLGTGIYTKTKKIPQIHHDCRLICKGDLFYLCVPIEIQTSKKVSMEENFCAIDPGVRTFITVWSLDESSKYGEKLASRLFSRLVSLDKLRSKIDTEKNKRKKTRKHKAFKRLSRRLQNIQKDVHYKVASDLCDKYDNIIIPEFESKNMSSKATRKLKTKTVRQMSCLAHGKFRQRLIEMASKRGKNVFICSEEYTTKTCCCCKTRNFVGSKEIFKCSSCGFTEDRDVHGGFNIILKFITENSITVSVVERHPR